MSGEPQINLSDLDGDQLQLAELIGLENYMKIVETFGGSTIYIRKRDSLMQNERDKEICGKFDGFNFRELALEYNLTERTIRTIVGEITQEVRARPLDNQIPMAGWEVNS